MSNSVRVFAPATLANVGSGFDLLGLALYGPGDEVEIVPNDKHCLQIVSIEGDEGKLPFNIDKNTCTVAMLAMMQQLEIDQGFDIYIHKKMPFGSGLGSSAASAVAGVFALNEFFNSPISRHELIKFAMEGEFLASNGYHADNIAPCLLGGITFIYDTENLKIEEIQCESDLYFNLAYQDIEILTADARKLLPDNYSRKTVIHQQSNFASLILGLINGNYKLIKQGLSDEIAVPFRKKLISNYDDIEKIALDNGALGFSISGSGPTVFSLSDDESKSTNINNDWNKYLSSKSNKYLCFQSKVNNEGAKRIPSLI